MTLELSIKSPELLAVTGSNLYGVSTPTSDLDLRGFTIPPKEYLYGIENFDQFEDPETDTVIYSMKKFFKLLVNGNTQSIETLFANDYHVLTDIGQKVVDNRKLFMSKRYYRSMRGFAIAEWRKAKVVQLVIDAGTNRNDLIQNLCSSFNLKRFQRDYILTLLEEYTGEKIMQETPHVNQIGKRRKEDVEKYGFSPKNAYHAIRILSQGIELLTSSTIIYPRPESEFLRAIRQGLVAFEVIEHKFNALEKAFILAETNSSLPKSADMDKVNKLYMEIVDEKCNQNFSCCN